MEIADFISPVITALITGITLYIGTSNKVAVLETLIVELKSQVEKHNQVIERTYKLESDCANLEHRIERLESNE